VSEEVVSALRYAAERIRDFHLARKRDLSGTRNTGGIGLVVRPLRRVGVYVPGGRASYPSTVLMTTLPAMVAGVNEIVMCTPPGRDGVVPAQTIVAADVAGVDKVFAIGGAQAIAAMAYGTESVPRVDKVCGPGNMFVTLAKKMVYGTVAIDGLQGPSELVIVADDSARPELCAADLLAQGEHDAMASAVMITTSPSLAERVQGEIEMQRKRLKRLGILMESVVEGGVIAVVDDMEEAVELVDLYAPEHVSLMVRDSDAYASRIHNVGCIFTGECPPALGDYVAGPSHVLPTGGTARFASPLGVDDFLKTTSVISFPGGIPDELASVACIIAQAEGLDAHCRSIQMRMGWNG
jgi:histidinol dehydrogenase